MKKINLIFLGRRILGKRCLDILHKYKNKINTVYVIGPKKEGDIGSDWNPPIVPYAKKLGFLTLEPENLSSPEIIAFFKSLHFDVLLNAFCNRIIPKEIIDIPTLGCINFHYGKLPFYKGRFIVNHIIFNCEKKTCTTAHYLTENIDAGDIIFEKEVKINPHETARSLYFKCTDSATGLFEKTLQFLIDNEPLPRIKQKNSGKYYPFEELNNCKVDFNWRKDKIKKFIRAVSFPPVSIPWIEISGKKFKIIEEI